MMKYCWIFCLFLASCQCGIPENSLEEIERIMAVQERDWSDGDIDGFMAYYHPDVCFMGKNEQTCGKEKVTANYRESYPDRGAMGILVFRNWEILPVEPSNAWVSGTWELHRSQDTLHGRYSLLWQFEDHEWLILRDHSDMACE